MVIDDHPVPAPFPIDEAVACRKALCLSILHIRESVVTAVDRDVAVDPDNGDLTELWLTAQAIGDPGEEQLLCSGVDSNSDRRLMAELRPSLRKQIDALLPVVLSCYESVTRCRYPAY